MIIRFSHDGHRFEVIREDFTFRIKVDGNQWGSGRLYGAKIPENADWLRNKVTAMWDAEKIDRERWLEEDERHGD